MKNFFINNNLSFILTTLVFFIACQEDGGIPLKNESGAVPVINKLYLEFYQKTLPVAQLVNSAMDAEGGGAVGPSSGPPVINAPGTTGSGTSVIAGPGTNEPDSGSGGTSQTAQQQELAALRADLEKKQADYFAVTEPIGSSGQRIMKDGQDIGKVAGLQSEYLDAQDRLERSETGIRNVHYQNVQDLRSAKSELQGLKDSGVTGQQITEAKAQVSEMQQKVNQSEPNYDRLVTNGPGPPKLGLTEAMEEDEELFLQSNKLCYSTTAYFVTSQVIIFLDDANNKCGGSISIRAKTSTDDDSGFYWLRKDSIDYTLNLGQVSLANQNWTISTFFKLDSSNSIALSTFHEGDNPTGQSGAILLIIEAVEKAYPAIPHEIAQEQCKLHQKKNLESTNICSLTKD